MKKVLLKDGRELLIRPAEEDDAAAVIEYINSVGGESNFLTYGKNGLRVTVERERGFLRDMRDQPGGICLTGWIGDELACFADLRAERKERLAHNCELGITVRKKYWDLGAASALLAELIGFAKGNPALKAIHLDVYGNNERAIRLYEKFGFQKVGRLKNYFRVGGSYYDDVIMDLYL